MERGLSEARGGSPRAIVEVRTGRHAGRLARVAPGEVLRVGRTELSDLVISSDEEMSARHFEVRWDGRVCRVIDLGSMTGTFIGGERRAEGEVAHGAWVRAGETDFSVYLEGHAPPPDDTATLVLDPAEARREPERLAAADRALAALREEAARGSLYAVLDAARGRRILELLRGSAEERRLLYDGILGAALAEMGPYLVRLPPESALLDALVREGWQRKWGIFIVYERPFDELRRHLRRFLKVESEASREQLYFRFYDPWVLGAFLPTCTVRQAWQFFGDVRLFLAEDEEGDLRRYPAPAGSRS